MFIRIITSLIILIVVSLGFKHGIGMILGKPGIIAVFEKAGFTRSTEIAFGVLTITGALLIVVPQTFFAGNILMAIMILINLCIHVYLNDIKGAGMEIPFLLLNILLIYLQYPFFKP